MRHLIAAFLLSLPLLAYADQPKDLQPLPEIPPAAGIAGQSTQPQVTVKQKGNSKVEEYRVNGRLYMIKVTPAKGKSYYLVDTHGDGCARARASRPRR